MKKEELLRLADDLENSPSNYADRDLSTRFLLALGYQKIDPPRDSDRPLYSRWKHGVVPPQTLPVFDMHFVFGEVLPVISAGRKVSLSMGGTGPCRVKIEGKEEYHAQNSNASKALAACLCRMMAGEHCA